MDEPDKKPGVASLERGLAILEAFQRGGDSLSLVELRELTGLYKSTILRLSASLLRRGYMERQPDGRYSLGSTVFRLGGIYQSSFRLADAVTPVLRSLAAKTSEGASFWVPDGDSEICLYRVESIHVLRTAGIFEGARFRLLDDESASLMNAFSGAVGEKYDRIRNEVTLVARKSKRVPGGSAVVAPVFTFQQKLMGIIVLSGPETRFPEERIENLRLEVTEHAAMLTRTLGGNTAIFASVLDESAISRLAT